MSTNTLRWRGLIEKWNFDSWTRIALVQPDGYKIDLINRVNEAVANYGYRVSVRYWTCSSQLPDEQIEEGALRRIIGVITAEFTSHEYSYSEYTHGVDYITTFEAGGHNMLGELLSNEGKWIVIEISFEKS